MDKHRPPPELTGDNYAYWKARTRMHLRAQGVWKTVLSGWDHPTKAGEKEGDPQVINPEVEWTVTEATTTSYNAKALDIIFSLIHESQFNLITGCDTAKEAWEILETTYEGTTSVKQSKLQLVQNDFEDLRMNEDENIVSFNERVQEIANRAVTLGKPFSQQKLIKKVLRSLPPRFRMKVTAIQEHPGWKKQNLAELMGNLKTYEMEILTDHSRKQKNVAFTADEQGPESDPDEIEDDDPIVLLTKHFNKILKQVKQKKSFRGNKSQNFKGSNTSKPNTTLNRSNYKPTGPRTTQPSATRTIQPRERTSGKGIRCYECEGYGHVQAECATYLLMAALTWSDDEVDLEAEADSEGCDYNSAEDLDIPTFSYEIEYKKLYPKWECLLKANRSLCSQVGILEKASKVYKNQISERDLLLEVTSAQEAKLKQEVVKLTQELTTLKKQIQMMNTASTLDDILDTGRQSTTKYRLGF